MPPLQHSRALIVLADGGAAFRRKSPLPDHLYEQLDWWARRRSAPPILVQLDRSALNLVGDPALSKWRKVNFIPAAWESWKAPPDGGEREKARLLSQIRESIQTYSEIVHLEEVRRLRRRAYWEHVWMYNTAAG